MGASQLPGKKSGAFLKAGWTFLCDLSSKIALLVRGGGGGQPKGRGWLSHRKDLFTD